MRRSMVPCLVGLLLACSAIAQTTTVDVEGGLVVCIGAEALESVVDDWEKPGCVFHCLEASHAKISRLREKVQAAGCYGKVSVAQFDGRRLPYINNLVNLIVITDTHGRIQYVNPAFERVTGYTAEEAIGQPLEIIIPEGTILNAGYPAATTFGNHLCPPNADAIQRSNGEDLASRSVKARIREAKATGAEVLVTVVKTSEKQETIDGVRQAVADRVGAAGRVLDVGCGRGVILGALANRGFEVHGVEIGDAEEKAATTTKSKPRRKVKRLAS